MRIILASSSPRRYELMKLLNVPFEVITKDVDETFVGNDIVKASMEVSQRKAKAVFDEIDGDVIVIGGDSVVYKDGVVFGKPKNYEEAYHMLKSYSDNYHEVITSLCMLIRKDGKVYEELTYEKPVIYFDKLTDEEIKDWISNNDVYGKAGAYAIQEEFGKHIKRIEGDYFAIVGLSIHQVYELLKKYQ